MKDELTPEDERAIQDAYEVRKRKEQEDAAAALPRCCALYWSRHTRECPKRTYSADGAQWWAFCWRMVKRVLR